MNNEEVLDSIKHLIGTRYVPSVKAYLSELTGCPKVIGPYDAYTLEREDDRLNIIGDDAGLIQSFWVG
ncbi:hypothetical protein [Pseudomonas sp. nanlin1]|uniref:hypothetical protein n=1 Tax=Pseudomonas sp. nanlin1 TaxID=3040605 RepID=UPI00388EF2AC